MCEGVCMCVQYTRARARARAHTHTEAHQCDAQHAVDAGATEQIHNGAAPPPGRARATIGHVG
jgi:hypothetical protein